ncbi:MAG: hypothetical protein PHN81_02325 [Actinomycetota bacterium]|nr:hypothetical protein [Actinomycetota bacterium]MDD5600537.1 hypothetical protein [Actinomycetota bacterium]
MNNVNKYLKIARDAVIKPPSGNIEEKIINRISNIDNKDESLLDEKFLDFFKKSNSRLYQTAEKIRNNPGFFAGIIITVIFIISFFVLITKKLLDEGEKSADELKLSSPENKTNNN